MLTDYYKILDARLQRQHHLRQQRPDIRRHVRDYVEIVFQKDEDERCGRGYNLRDGLSRGTLFRCDIIVLPSEILSLLTLKALKVLCCYSSSTSASGSRNPPSVNPKERAPLWSRRRTRLL
jgi:hypothetical protein